MRYRLNLNHFTLALFLAFVSFLDRNLARAETLTATAAAPSGSSELENLKTRLTKEPQNIKLVLQLASAQNKAADQDSAKKLLWKYIDKLDRGGMVQLAKIHLDLKEPEEAIKIANMILAKNESDFEAHTLIGRALALKKKTHDAMESFKKAVDLNSKYEPAYNGLIDLYEKRNPPNYYELRIIYQDLIDNIGPRVQYLTKLCEVNVLDNVYEAAISACESAIKKNDTASDAYVFLGISLQATGNEEKGLKYLKKAASKFSNSELAQFSYAKALEDRKNFVEAMTFYKAGTKADAKSDRSWLGLANSLFELQKYEESLEAYIMACKINRKTASSFRKAASTLRIGQKSEWTGRFTNESDRCTNSN